jgi:hypothetical protein
MALEQFNLSKHTRQQAHTQSAGGACTRVPTYQVDRCHRHQTRLCVEGSLHPAVQQHDLLALGPAPLGTCHA